MSDLIHDLIQRIKDEIKDGETVFDVDQVRLLIAHIAGLEYDLKSCRGGSVIRTRINDLQVERIREQDAKIERLRGYLDYILKAASGFPHISSIAAKALEDE